MFLLLRSSLRSKTETKEATFKSISLVPGVVVSAPVFSAAKAASVFAAAEPDGYIVTVTEAGKPSLDLKIEGGVADANAWVTAMQLLITPAKH